MQAPTQPLAPPGSPASAADGGGGGGDSDAGGDKSPFIFDLYTLKKLRAQCFVFGNSNKDKSSPK